jgi:CBS domain-containing protein
MRTDFRTLGPTDTLGAAADLLLAGTQQNFPVVGDGQPGGVLTREALLAGLAHGGRETRVADVPLREPGRVEAGEPLVPAAARLREEGAPCLQVVDRGRPVGLLTLRISAST